ncbi:MAG TPA: succinate dehydrogenase, cytochrome b556 subunit [Acidiferrobacter sp.]|nr:succinate dehydrogenase, cytochrome b556 subunit [Acidiferrobacter sp.]
MTALERPRDAGLKYMRLPIGAYASILHRITGLLLVGVSVAGLRLLSLSLASASQFQRIQVTMTGPAAHVLGPLCVWAGAQHLYGGIRHLMFDIDTGCGRGRSRQSAAWVMALALATAILAALLWP